MVRCIIVDDEQKSRENLRILVQEFCENTQVVALCTNVEEAIQAIKLNKPDLVFLDIQIQSETGFDLLEKLTTIGFEIIFTTAYSEYAVKAFKFSAIDYLLKPIDIEELTAAVAKVQKKLNTNVAIQLEQLVQNLKSGSSNRFKLALPSSEGLVFVKVEEIIYCEASGNYTTIHMADGKKHIVSRTLKDYEDMLQQQNFFRIRNAYLINLNAVSKYVRGDGGYVIMSNNSSLDVSKRKKEGFLIRIGMKE